MPRLTPLNDVHRARGARLVEFAGWEMPVQYTSIVEEHRRVRRAVGLFDVSHMGRFEVRGPGARAFLDRMVTNDVASLPTGKAVYTPLCRPDGGILDDLLVYAFPDRLLVVVNAANAEKDWQWLAQHVTADAALEDRTAETALVAVQGRVAEELVARVTGDAVRALGYYECTSVEAAGATLLVGRTGYTGEDGFEIYVPSELAQSCWEAAMDAGEEFGIVPIGLGARDTLRLEMKYALYGNDIDDTTNPIEAGLGWVVKEGKAGEFIGKQDILDIKTSGPKRKLTAFVMDEKAIPRSRCEIRVNGAPVGQVTSGTHSPSLDKGIGLGYVTADHTKPGTKLDIVIRDRSVPATVIKPPFVTTTSHR